MTSPGRNRGTGFLDTVRHQSQTCSRPPSEMNLQPEELPPAVRVRRPCDDSDPRRRPWLWRKASERGYSRRTLPCQRCQGLWAAAAPSRSGTALAPRRTVRRPPRTHWRRRRGDTMAKGAKACRRSRGVAVRADTALGPRSASSAADAHGAQSHRGKAAPRSADPVLVHPPVQRRLSSCLLPAQRVSQWPPITRHAFPTGGRTGNRQDHGTTPTTVATFLHPVITDEMRPYAHVGSETVYKRQRVTDTRSEVGLQRSLKDETDKNN